MGKQWKQWQNLFSWAQNHWIWCLQPCSLEEKNRTNLDSILKSRDIYFANKDLSSQSYGFSSCHVWMWELEYKEIWAPKNWCFWTVLLEKTLESPLDSKETQPVHSKGNWFWIFIERTDIEAETLAILVIWFKELTHLKRP